MFNTPYHSKTFQQHKPTFPKSKCKISQECATTIFVYKTDKKLVFIRLNPIILGPPNPKKSNTLYGRIYMIIYIILTS